MNSKDEREYWLLRRPGESVEGAIYATVVGPFAGTDDGNGTRCSVCGAISIYRLREVTVELFGWEFMDFIWTDSLELLVTASTKAKLESLHDLQLEWWPVSVMAWWRSEAPGGDIINWLEREPPVSLFNIGIPSVVAHKRQADEHLICAACGRTQPQITPPVPDIPAFGKKELPMMFTVKGIPGYIYASSRAFSEMRQLRLSNIDFLQYKAASQ